MPRRTQDKEAAKTVALRLADAVRRLRLMRGCTQAEIAEKAGISLEAYARIERSRALPSFPTLMRLCDVLGVTPDDLLLAEPAGDATGRARVRRSQRAGSGDKPGAIQSPIACASSPILGDAEQAVLGKTIKLLSQLDRADRLAIDALVRHLAAKADMLPVPED